MGTLPPAPRAVNVWLTGFLMRAVKLGLIDENSHAVLDSTAHSLKFVDFQNMYFNDSFPPDYEVRPNPDLANKPVELYRRMRQTALIRHNLRSLARGLSRGKTGPEQRGKK